MDEFVEMHFGEAEGMTLKERLTAFPERVYPNQENESSFNKRVIAGIQEINRKYKDKKILLVAHGAVINAILYLFSNGKIGTGKQT